MRVGRGCFYLLVFELVVLFFEYLFNVVMLLLGVWFVGYFGVGEVVFRVVSVVGIFFCGERFWCVFEG